MFDEGSKIVPQWVGFLVKSAEEWDMGSYCTMGEVPSGLLPDEVLSMNSLCAPGMSLEEREAMVLDYQSPEYWNVEAINQRVMDYLS